MIIMCFHAECGLPCVFLCVDATLVRTGGARQQEMDIRRKGLMSSSEV